MKVKGFTLLTYEQVFSNQALKIFEKYGRNCSATDFACLLGIQDDDIRYSTSYGERAVIWFTKTTDENDSGKEAFCVAPNGNVARRYVTKCNIGVRPVIKYSTILPFITNKRKLGDGVLEVEYGEYPQDVVSKKKSDDLEIEYTNGRLKITGKVYKIGSRTFKEYEYKGKRFIRAKAQDNGHFSDGRRFEEFDIFWFEVLPIQYLVDEEKDVAFTKRVVFTGVELGKYIRYGEYRNTLQIFLNKQFAKDIIPSNQKKQSWFARLFSKKQKTPLALPPTQIPQEEIKQEEPKESTKPIMEEVNALISYIREKSLLLNENTRKHILNELDKVIKEYEGTMNAYQEVSVGEVTLQLDSIDMAPKNLLAKLSGIQFEVDLFLKDKEKVERPGKNYAKGLKKYLESINKISALNYNLCKKEMKKVLTFINQNDDINKLDPYIIDEVCNLCFLIFSKLDEASGNSLGNVLEELENEGIIINENLINKMILWFKLYKDENKESFDFDALLKYNELEKGKISNSSSWYIISLAGLLGQVNSNKKDENSIKNR